MFGACYSWVFATHIKHLQRKYALMNGRIASIIGIAVACVLAHRVAASSIYQFTIDRNASVATTSSDISAPLAGTFRGNYDAVNNATGTQTRPGLFGGSGNMPITYSGSFAAGGNTQTHPTGTFRVSVNTDSGTVVMSNLQMNALGADTPSFAATFNVLYQTFRTFQPSSLFPGGVTLPIPLGALTLDALTITQTTASPAGGLIPTGKGQFDYAVLVNATIAYSGTLSGTPVGNELPVVLAISGTLNVNGNGASSTVSIDWNLDETLPGPFTPFTDVPLDVPTVLPTGGTASLLFDGAIQSVTTQIGLESTIAANGQLDVPGDANGDGAVNVADLLAVITAWGACPTLPVACPADIAPFPGGDGQVNVSDLLLVVTNWGS